MQGTGGYGGLFEEEEDARAAAIAKFQELHPDWPIDMPQDLKHGQRPHASDMRCIVVLQYCWSACGKWRSAYKVYSINGILSRPCPL